MLLDPLFAQNLHFSRAPKTVCSGMHTSRSGKVWNIILHSLLFLSFQLIFSFFVQAQAQATSPGNDYDTDGTTDIAVWRLSTGEWWVLTSSSNFTTFFSVEWG